MSVEPNGNGGVSSWAKAIATVGIPGVLAIWLVYTGSAELPRIATLVADTKTQSELNRDLLREHMAQMDEALRLMRWICVGVSKDDNDRRNCFAK